MGRLAALTMYHYEDHNDLGLAAKLAAHVVLSQVVLSTTSLSENNQIACSITKGEIFLYNQIFSRDHSFKVLLDHVGIVQMPTGLTLGHPSLVATDKSTMLLV